MFVTTSRWLVLVCLGRVGALLTGGREVRHVVGTRVGAPFLGRKGRGSCTQWRSVPGEEGSEQPMIRLPQVPPSKYKDVNAKVPPREGWVMATRALRGEYDPDDPGADTERSSALLSALVDDYPTLYSFTAVGKVGDDISPDEFRDALVERVRPDVENVVDSTWTPRLGGRFASVQIHCIVHSPQAVQRVFDTLNAADRVTMTF
mmetsp:Transcript_13598/g.42931  ORF Transcript_13598/g.42931 Transcript_13598/m.42931 type:complete len:204 (-) Transcript_13598:42-653(-)